VKYFVISLCTGTYMFDFICSKISDAYNAIQEASADFGISVDLYRVMAALVHMDEGRVISYKRGNLIITAREGEAQRWEGQE